MTGRGHDRQAVAGEEAGWLVAARHGDAGAFDALVAPYRGELLAHCYRMLGSVQDAEDALQDALLGAWRGLPGFEGRASVRTWLYRITTNACIRLGERRPTRLLTIDRVPATTDPWQVGEFIDDRGWLEPYPGSLVDASTASANPQARYEARESVELAYVAALQHLPATQRAVLILREVLAFSAAEVADLLDTTVAAVNSALQRARAALAQRRAGGLSQQATLRALGERRQRELVHAFVNAWERADIPALLDMLVEDARFTMPPLPAWFAGRDAIAGFLSERMFETPWRFVPASANGQVAFAAYQWRPGEAGEPVPADATFRLSAINVLTLRGDRIAEICGFLDRGVFPYFGFPAELAT